MSNKKEICIIAMGELSTNPRSLKELFTLQAAGYDVSFIGSYCVDWALKYDAEIAARNRININIIDWSAGTHPFLFWKTRLRYFIARKIYQLFGFSFLEKYVLHRIYPEVMRAALLKKADFYIAHNLSALPIAYVASSKFKAAFGFDAEDFYSEDSLPERFGQRLKELAERTERRYLPQSRYISASSEPIARAYVKKYALPEPVVLLNVFSSFGEYSKVPVARKGRLSLYWFSQTIGENRGLEEAVLALKNANSDIYLYLQGNISNYYRRNLQKLAGSKKEKLVFLMPCSPEELMSTASEFDVGLALERKEPLNRDLCVTNKIFIYLSAGLSIIATNTKGQSGIISSIGKSGWLYDCGDVRALAERLDYLALNKEYLEESKKEALRYAQDKYNWDIEKKKFLDVIEKVLG